MSTMSDRDVIAWARQYGALSAMMGDDDGVKLRRLAELAEKGAEDWQPIASAPADSLVMLADKYTLRIFVGCKRPDGETQVIYEEGSEPMRATHWRPLPAPPGGGR